MLTSRLFPTLWEGPELLVRGSLATTVQEPGGKEAPTGRVGQQESRAGNICHSHQARNQGKPRSFFSQKAERPQP